MIMRNKCLLTVIASKTLCLLKKKKQSENDQVNYVTNFMFNHH